MCISWYITNNQGKAYLFLFVFCDLNPTGQRNVIIAVILRCWWVVLSQRNASALPGNGGSVPFCPVEWWVKFQVRRNRSRYISSEISGYIGYNEANQERQRLASGMKEEYGKFFAWFIGCWSLLNWLIVTYFFRQV